MGDDEPTLLTGSPTRSYDSDGSVGPELEEIPLVGRRRLPGLTNNPEQKATHYWVRYTYSKYVASDLRKKKRFMRFIIVNLGMQIEKKLLHFHFWPSC